MKSAAPLLSVSRRYRLTLAYDGTAYAGWQVQARHATVQQTVERLLADLVGHDCKLHGSGRTDQGVHAEGQVAHVDLATPITPTGLMRALNGRLPDDIRVLKAAFAAPDFHARRSAIAKEYRYTVWNAPILPPGRRLYATHVQRPLDLAAMRAACAHFVGRHDFAAFMANPNRMVETTVRRIDAFTVTRRGAEIRFRVRGEGFLYKQVRSMVGLLLRVGEGAETPAFIAELLTAHAPRTARVPSAPPQGLTLWKVWY